MANTAISASTTIEAPPDAIFAILADPAKHADIDGTGWVCDPVDRQPLVASGQIFRMAMYHPGHALLRLVGSHRGGAALPGALAAVLPRPLGRFVDQPRETGRGLSHAHDRSARTLDNSRDLSAEIVQGSGVSRGSGTRRDGGVGDGRLELPTSRV